MTNPSWRRVHFIKSPIHSYQAEFMKKFSSFRSSSLLLASLGLTPTARRTHDHWRDCGPTARQDIDGARVSELLDGYSLQEASIMADTIKQWDKPGIEDPKVQKYFSSHPKIAEQLRAFWKANPPATEEKPANPFAPLVSLHRRAAEGRRKIWRRQSGAEPMGHRPHDGLLH